MFKGTGSIPIPPGRPVVTPPVVGPVVIPKETDKSSNVKQAPIPNENSSPLPIAPKIEEK